ncbi:hypothetical protein N864_04625, partial [Intrasporangium chromatireducens Q5-1]
PSGGPTPVLRFRTLASLVSSQLDGDLLYRGRPIEEVVRDLTFDDAVALVLGATGPGAFRGSGGPTLARLAEVLPGLPPERRLPVGVQLLAGADPLAVDLDPDRVRLAAVTAVHACLASTAPEAALSGDPVADVPALLLAGLRGGRPSRPDVELLRVLLTAL